MVVDSYEARVLQTGDDFVGEGVGDDGVGGGAAFPGEGGLCVCHDGGGGGDGRCGGYGGCLIQRGISSSERWMVDDTGWEASVVCSFFVRSFVRSLVGCACRIVVPRLLCLSNCRSDPGPQVHRCLLHVKRPTSLDADSTPAGNPSSQMPEAAKTVGAYLTRYSAFAAICCCRRGCRRYFPASSGRGTAPVQLLLRLILFP